MFDRSTTDGVWLDHDAFDDAQPSVFGHAHFDQEALAREGTVPDPDLVLDPEDPRLPLPRLRLWWDEQPHPDAGLLDRDALALEQVARFEEEGLHLDHVALAFDLQLGVFGHGRLGQAGFVGRGAPTPPEGWRAPPKKTSLKLELSDIADETSPDGDQTGEDDGR
ncbi:MAG TPA: hypothetical protein PLA94_26930, partial [Myxococcota bacterium]|nr:hypothetical protein [Myxococcota bacterium]